ncbi:MAG: GDSL-type esterase/lipase family protein [Patescibacteria group bacterium]
MIFPFKNLVIGIVALLIILFVVDAIRFYLLFKKGKVLAENSVPFERIGVSSENKILVLGDSTAVGTGVVNPELSTAGRLATFYPDAIVRNLAVNGMRLKGLQAVLGAINKEEKFSIILVQIGANDIIRLTSMSDIEKDLEEILQRLSTQTDKLVILHSGNVGESRFFPIYMRKILSKRSFEMREIYKKLASKYNAHYVDLIDAPAEPLLRNNPKKYYAEDFLHLSDDGYGLWFDEIKKVL